MRPSAEHAVNPSWKEKPGKAQRLSGNPSDPISEGQRPLGCAPEGGHLPQRRQRGRSDPDDEPLVVRPSRARKMLGGPSNSFFYVTILPQLRSFLEGRSRWIETKSIHEYIARRLAENAKNPRAKRGPGRPLGSRNKPKSSPLTAATEAGVEA
jgi:hypothetical protein